MLLPSRSSTILGFSPGIGVLSRSLSRVPRSLLDRVVERRKRLGQSRFHHTAPPTMSPTAFQQHPQKHPQQHLPPSANPDPYSPSQPTSPNAALRYNECQDTFPKQHLLRTHMKKHSLPFKCTETTTQAAGGGGGTTRRDNHDRHVRQQHPRRQHEDEREEDTCTTRMAHNKVRLSGMRHKFHLEVFRIERTVGVFKDPRI
ncbi:hypothetical protein B0T26DRAFT_807726 [Lasiosphaeria miniovina]|uniref:Uncharacterized protein n=1 Tax=Lasiosphaeria miniovina TaxID=1954250 RepID=A0AA40DJ63_9PEZI|nr:uncharacterized protein B0T26DRAFT_807726 [Lasiosphaeria miniovina]KAK0701868.1 hypothetical protein B0T26DRAFT_807726 [Lasiosphaeria miniovina]